MPASTHTHTPTRTHAAVGIKIKIKCCLAVNCIPACGQDCGQNGSNGCQCHRNQPTQPGCCSRKRKKICVVISHLAVLLPDSKFPHGSFFSPSPPSQPLQPDAAVSYRCLVPFGASCCILLHFTTSTTLHEPPRGPSLDNVKYCIICIICTITVLMKSTPGSLIKDHTNSGSPR